MIPITCPDNAGMYYSSAAAGTLPNFLNFNARLVLVKERKTVDLALTQSFKLQHSALYFLHSASHRK